LPAINFAQVLIAFVVLLFSLTVHEMAHAWTAERLGDPTGRLLGRVSLNPIVHADPIGTLLFPLLALLSGVPVIGWAKPVPVNVGRLRRQRRDFMLVAAAGPASNLLLAAGAALLVRLVPHGSAGIGGLFASGPVAAFVGNLIELNLLLAVFNMIPIPPLDGGNVLSGLLPRSLGTHFDLLRPYGFLLIYALMFSGTLARIVTPPYYFLLSWLL
jgi:Zn-dependent protease